MKISAFATKTDLLAKSELQKVRLLAYYQMRTQNHKQFTTMDVSEWFDQLDLAPPNSSRLRGNLAKSKLFIKGGLANTFKLNAKEIADLDAEYPHMVEKSEDVVSSDEILPESLFSHTRGFVESLSKQINASYESNVFDGTAVLMRRLIEVLIVLAYEANGIQASIQDQNGDYKNLSKIIGAAITNKTLALSKTTKSSLDGFRTLGNFSAHQIYYNAKRKDIQKASAEFRAAVEELLYKSGIKT